jgi:putative MATE family efflux protein
MERAGTDVLAPSMVEPESGGYRRIWELAWPVSISSSTLTLLTLVNLLWIGRLGTVAVAAVSLCGNILFIVFGISNIVFAGAVAIVSRRVGEKNTAAAFSASVHAVALGALLGLLVAALGYVAAPPIVNFFDAGAAVGDLAIAYLRIMFAGQLFLYVSIALGATYQAHGDTRTPMLVNVAVVLLNGILDPFFIFAPRQLRLGSLAIGWLGWGVNGGAIAAVLSGAIGCAGLLAVSFLLGRPAPRPPGLRVSPSPGELWRMTRIGLPASLSMIARPLSTFLLLKVIASFGTAAIAAFGISLRSFSVNWIPYSGINAAVSTLVGQNLGARNVRQAERVVWRGLAVTTLLGVFFCVLYFGLARQIIAAFDGEPDVVAAGVPFLQLIAISFLFNGPMLPLMSAMNGAGDTKPPMIVAFLANWPVKLPLSWALALPLGYGLNGVWIGMFISIIFEAVVMIVWYSRGKWKTKKV